MTAAPGEQILADSWALAYQNAAVQEVVGEGIGGGAGWSPKWGDFLIEGVTLMGADFLRTGPTTQTVTLDIEKNGTTSLYALSYQHNGAGFSAWPSASALHSASSTTPQILKASDYICVDVGNGGYASGTLISKDVQATIYGRYITGPLSEPKGHRGRRARVRLFNAFGAISNFTYVYNFLGVNDAKYTGGTGFVYPSNYVAWSVPRRMRVWRIIWFATVGFFPAVGQATSLHLTLWNGDCTDPAGTGTTPVLQATLAGTATINNVDQLVQAVGPVDFDVGDELTLQLQMEAVSGTPLAMNVQNLSCFADVEFL